MARRYYAMLPFHPSYNFVVFKAFTHQGVNYVRDDPFPAEGSGRPADTLLEKLYRQKYITGAAPGVAEAENEPMEGQEGADGTDAPEGGENAPDGAESGAGGDADETGTDDGTDSTKTPPETGQETGNASDDESGQGGASDEAPADNAAPENPDAESQEPAEDAADVGGQQSGADDGAGAAGADADGPAAGLKPFHNGFGKWSVLDEAGKVVHEGPLSKAEAYAKAGVELPKE